VVTFVTNLCHVLVFVSSYACLQRLRVCIRTTRQTQVQKNALHSLFDFFADSAIMEALTELSHLVSLSEDFEQRRPVIQSALENDGHILSKHLDLALFLDPKFQNVDLAPSTFQTTTTQSKNLHSAYSFTLFQLACTKFIQAMACDQHPVVLV
jgi:hypothetical protein